MEIEDIKVELERLHTRLAELADLLVESSADRRDRLTGRADIQKEKYLATNEILTQLRQLLTKRLSDGELAHPLLRLGC